MDSDRKEFTLKKPDGTEENLWYSVSEHQRYLTWRRKREAYFWKYRPYVLAGSPVPPFDENEFE